MSAAATGTRRDRARSSPACSATAVRCLTTATTQRLLLLLLALLQCCGLCGAAVAATTTSTTTTDADAAIFLLRKPPAPSPSRPLPLPAPPCPDAALQEYSAQAGRCCRRCPPGSGVTRPCDSSNDTVCAPCRDGVTFSPTETKKDGGGGVAHHQQQHHLQRCAACSASPDRAVVTRRCNATHDTQWECSRGHYYNSTGRSCTACLSCAEGWGVLVPCDPWSDARCIKCPEGTYSSTAPTPGGGGFDGAAAVSAALLPPSVRSCIVCTKCSAHQVMLHECTSTQDTVCLDVKKHKAVVDGDANQQKAHGPGRDERTQQQLPSSSAAATGSAAAAGSPSEFPTVPLYCAILGTVVVGLLLYVVIRCRPTKGRKQREFGCAGSSSGGGGKPPVKADLVALLNGAGKAPTVTPPPPRIVHYSDVPAGKRKDAATLLQRSDVIGDFNWQGLAKLLGFSQTRIDEITERAKQDCIPAAHYMLNDWSVRCGHAATLEMLVHSLMRLGRTDVVHQLLTKTTVSHGTHGNELP